MRLKESTERSLAIHVNVLRHLKTSLIPEIRRSTQHIKNIKEEMKLTTINLKAYN